MAEFDQRIQQIQTRIEGLTTSLRDVESAVSEASQQFEAMSRNAENINTVVTSVSRLEKLVSKLDNATFVDKLREQISAISKEIGKLNVDKLNTASQAIEGQAQALAALNRAQVNINQNFRRTSEVVQQMLTGLGNLSKEADNLGSGLATSVDRISASLQTMTPHVQGLQAVTASINNLDLTNINQAAAALQAISAAITEIDGKKLNVNATTPRGERQPRTASNEPSAKTKAFAEEHGIDLSTYTKKPTLGDVRQDYAKAQKLAQEVAAQTKAAEEAAAEAEKLQRRIVQRQQKYEVWHQKAQAVDRALAQLAQTQRKVFEAAASDLPADIKDDAFKAVVQGNAQSKTKIMGGNSDDRRAFVNTLNNYEKSLSKQPPIEVPEFDGFEKVLASDAEKIKKLIAERANLSKTAAETRKILETVGVDVSNMPNFKLDPSTILSGSSNIITSASSAGSGALDSIKTKAAEVAKSITTKAEAAITEAAKAHLNSMEGRFGALEFSLAGYLGNEYQYNAPKGKAKPGAARPGAVKYNPSAGQFFTGYENIEGQESSEQQQFDNLAAINRALDLSPHGMIIVGTAASAGGASRVAFGAAGKQDHSAVIHRNADRKLDVYELRPSDEMTPDNQTQTPYFGSKPGNVFDVDELAKAGRIDAVPLGVEVSEVQADTFLDALKRRAATGTYSFLGNGDTCATYVAGALSDAGIADQGFGDTSGGLNLTRPEDITNAIVKKRQEHYSKQDPKKAQADLESVTELTKEQTESYEAIIAARVQSIKTAIKLDKETREAVKKAAAAENMSQHDYIQHVARNANPYDDEEDRFGFAQPGRRFNGADVSNATLRPQQYLKEALDKKQLQAENELASIEANQSTFHRTGKALQGSDNETISQFGSKLLEAEQKMKDSMARFSALFDDFSTAGLQKLSNTVLAATASFEALLSFLRAKIPGFSAAYSAVSEVAGTVGGAVSGGVKQAGMFANDAAAGVQFHAAMAQEALSTTLDATVQQQITGIATPGSAQTSVQSLREKISAFFQKFSGSISSYIERFSDWLTTFVHGKKPEVPSGIMANASIASTVGNIATSASRDFYRPASYGFSQLGALLNSVRSVAKGAQQGGIGGGLDIAGGVLKGVNAVSNANAVLGLNLFPKGFGETFSNSRSQTMMDLIETVTGLGTGYGRGAEQKQLRSLRGEERTKESYIRGIEYARQQPNSEQQAKALDTEMQKAKNELAELRKTIRAYQEVLKNQAEKEIRTDQYKSTGSKLDVNAKLLNVSKEITFSDVYDQLSETDRRLSVQAQESLGRFSQGTGLAPLSGTAVVAEDLRSIARLAYNEQSIPDGDMQGLNIPAYQDDGRTKASFVSLVKTGTQDAAQTFVHELVHGLTEDQARTTDNGVLYRAPGQRGGAVFGNEELQQAAWMRKAELGGADKNAVMDLVESAASLQGQPSDMMHSVAKDSAFRNYMFSPTEITAHIGEALISGNSDLEEALRKIYGPELFEKVHKELAAQLPDTFADEPLKALRSRFGQLDKELSGSTQQLGQQQSGGFMDNIQSFINKLMTAFSESLGPLGTQVSGLIQEFFSSLGISKGIQDPGIQANAKLNPVNSFFGQLKSAFTQSKDPVDPIDSARSFGSTIATGISGTLETAFRRFSSGTGLHEASKAGIVAIDSKNVATAVRRFLGDAEATAIAPNAGLVGGMSLPVNNSSGDRVGSLTAINRDAIQASKSRTSGGELLVHENVHDLTLNRSANLLASDRNKFTDVSLEEARTKRLGEVDGFSMASFAALTKIKQADQGLGYAKDASDNGNYRNYILSASEMYAHVGQAVISGNKKLESELTAIYGKDLYDKVAGSLRKALPDTFGDDAIVTLRDRFQKFDAQVTGLFDADGTRQQPTANARMTPGGVDTNQYIDKYFAEFVDLMAPRNVQHLVGTLTKDRGITAVMGDVAKAAADPAGTAERGINKLQNLNVRELANNYAARIIKDIEFPLGLVGKAIQNSGLPDKIFEKITASIESVVIGGQGASPLVQRGVQELLRVGIESQLPTEVSFRDELNSYVRGKTGKNIQAGSYQQSAQFNPQTGMTEFALSARTAEGAMVSLNGHLDEFGRKKIDNPAKAMSSMAGFMKEFASAIPRELGYQATYSVVNSIQSAFSQILGIQDELNEVVNAYGVGQGTPQASNIKYNFLRDSVQTAQQTGQGFDEAVQTNLKNFKILGSVQDEGQRGELSNQLSKVQLGAQTAFGITLEQSLEAIPAVLTSISDGLEGVEDPVERTTQSITLLQEVMDKMVVAQRSSGASGEEMITVFSRLAASAKEYGLTQQELIALTATSSVSIGKGSDETSNVLRTLLEGTYSPEKQSALRDLGITTKVFNPNTNKIQNRDFNDIMDELTKFISDPETKDRAPELFQVFGGPKLAPDIGKVIRGYSSNYDRVDQTIDQQYTGDNFDTLVAQKSQNLQGSLKKLAASATEMFNTFLVGTGAMDEASKFLDRLADTASRLTEFFGESGGALKEFFTFAMSMAKYNLIGELSKNVNIFSPLAKGMGAVKVGVSSAISSLVDFGKEGDSSSNRLLRGFKLLGTVFNDLEKEIRGTNSAVKQVGATAVTTATQVKAATQTGNLSNPRVAGSPAFMQATMFDADGKVKPQAYTQQSMFDDGATPNARMVAAGGATGSATSRGINPGLLGFMGRTFDRISTATPAFGGLSSWWANNKNPMRNAAMTVGDNAGSMLAPMGFDLVTGGLNKSNVINTVGAGLAGTFLGSITASPQLGLVGYGMAKSFLDNVDFSKFFGASQKEMESFSTAVAEAIRKANLTPEQQALEEKATAVGQEQETAIGKMARENFGKLDQTLGLSKFDENFAKFVNSQGLINRARLATPGAGLASSDLEQYQRLIVNGETAKDNRFFGKDSRFVRGYENGSASQVATEQLYQALGTDELRDLYSKANVTDPTKFLQMFQQLQEGKGELLKNSDIREIISQLAKTGGVDAKLDSGGTAGGNVVASLETSNDIIKRINENLSEFNLESAKMRDTPLGITQYGEFGKQTTALDEKFAPQLEGIRSGSITGDEAKRIMEQYDKSRASLTAMPASLQQIMPLAQDLGLNTKGLEQKFYNIGAEGQGQLVQRFGQAQQSNSFVQDYEGRQRALQQYESSDLYKAKDAAILKEHDTLKKALETDKARYNINKEYLALITSQKDVLLDQAGAIEKQNQTRQLISAGTPATFSPMSLFDTKGFSSGQINKAIQQALEKQAQLEKMSPGYKKYFGEQQFLMQGKGGFKPVTGIDQGFMQEALQSQQIQPPNLEDLSQFSDTQLDKILNRARGLQDQAVALNPDLAGKYDNERIMIYRKNNQLLQQTGLSQEYLKLAIQENTKSNETLRGHYNMPTGYKAPKVWDYYAEGGKEMGDVNFPNQLGQGAMVPLSFAQQLAQEILNGQKGTEGADLSAITNTTGPGGGAPVFYTGGSAPVWSDPVPVPLPDTIRDTPKLPPGSDLEALRDMSTKAYQEQRRAKELERYKNIEPSSATRATSMGKSSGYDDPGYTSGGSIGGSAPLTQSFDEVINTNKSFGKTAHEASGGLDGMRQAVMQTGKSVASLNDASMIASASLRGVAGLTVGAQAFNGAITSLVAKVQQLDLVNALKKANIVIQINGATVPGTPVVNNGSGGGGSTLTAAPAARTRLS